MIIKNSSYSRITIFLAATFLSAYSIDFSINFFGGSEEFLVVYQLALMARMFTPLLGVILAILLTGDSLKDSLKNYGARLGRNFLKCFAAAVLIPPAILALGAAYAIAVGLPVQNPAEALLNQLGGDLPIDPSTFLFIIITSSILTGATFNAVFAFGEEIGWRGLLLEELRNKLGYVKTTLLIGAIWSAWHFPLILLFGYNYPENRGLGLILYTLLCIIWTGILVILKDRSGSVIHPSVMHGTLNAFGGLMVMSVPVERIIGLPVGILSIASSSTILAVLVLIFTKYPRS